MGTTTHAARRDGNVIIHVANGITHIGPARQQDGDYSYLADILQTVLPDVAWHNNIRAELWRKLAVNCVINPLTAIWNCPNGELRHHPQEIMQICEEVAAVIEREGHHTSAEDLRDYVMQVIDATAEISRRCCRISARCATPKSTISMVFSYAAPARMGLPYRKHPPV